jgi:hypothetical protein
MIFIHEDLTTFLGINEIKYCVSGYSTTVSEITFCRRLNIYVIK